MTPVVRQIQFYQRGMKGRTYTALICGAAAVMAIGALIRIHPIAWIGFGGIVAVVAVKAFQDVRFPIKGTIRIMDTGLEITQKGGTVLISWNDVKEIDPFYTEDTLILDFNKRLGKSVGFRFLDYDVFANEFIKPGSLLGDIIESVKSYNSVLSDKAGQPVAFSKGFAGTTAAKLLTLLFILMICAGVLMIIFSPGKISWASGRGLLSAPASAAGIYLTRKTNAKLHNAIDWQMEQ